MRERWAQPQKNSTEMSLLKNIFGNKYYTLSLVAYIAFQFFWPLAELFFFASIIIAVVWISKNHERSNNFLPFLYTTLLSFLANLLLILVYIPMLLLNREINWSLNGETTESDPMILLAYLPTLNFIIFLLIVGIQTLSLKIHQKEL
jgi:hypothetical protein